jgi:preprotein translocase subunit SecF
MGKFSRLGNDLYKGEVSVDFVGRWKTWYFISGVIVVLAIFGLTWKGLNLGIEFEGGTEYSVSVPTEG